MFIGRKEEINQIIDRLDNNKRELIAITGKRGVGKTELMNIVEKIYLKKENVRTYYFYGQKNASMKKQIQNLCLSIDENFDFKKISNWNLFFKYFDKVIKTRKSDEKIIVFIDEFPWLNTKGSNFIDDFGTFWNRNNYENFKIVLTGSAVSWINQNVFRSKGGLCHKTTLKIKLKSFSMQETMEYLLKENSNFTNSELVEYYLMTGGVVRYLQNIHSNRTIEENYNSIYKNNYFDDFFDNTFNSVKTNIHKKIISMFSNRIKIKIEDIEKEIINVSHQLIYNTIKELVETDLLIEIKDNGSKKNKSYILSDL